LTGEGKLHIKNAKHTLSDEPLDADCARSVPTPQPRYIRHLFQVGS
jgi:queuine/archaeosine tRNA-ribosyltransferase